MSEWWRHAVIYQVYIRSFRDANSDGIGDVEGIREQLPYLKKLGVDAIWVTPWYVSPMADGGYDVADYYEIDPALGTLKQAKLLISEAHAADIKIILDLVPNHTSAKHQWFQEALNSPEGSKARDRYIFKQTDSVNKVDPPTDWPSVFGGQAWTQTRKADGSKGEWYLHLFDSQQPDLNWNNQEVRQEFERIIKYWFDLGVDGFRIDVAHGLIKDQSFPNLGVSSEQLLDIEHKDNHPFWDRDEVHDIYRSWRKIADSYNPPRVFVAEAWVHSGERLARYLRKDELHTGFNFEFLTAAWSADSMRRVINDSLKTAEQANAPNTWVLSNHDVVRHLSRYARQKQVDGAHHLAEVQACGEADLAVGERRARAAALLMLALPGCAYIYQGEELGLEEVEDIPNEFLQDPTWERSGYTDRGRDGCRVPIPWGDEKANNPSWLPQPAHWRSEKSALMQENDASSMLNLYRAAIAIRKEYGEGVDSVVWCEFEADVLAFEVGRLLCVVNFSDKPIKLPSDKQILLASSSAKNLGYLEPDTAAWLM